MENRGLVILSVFVFVVTLFVLPQHTSGYAVSAHGEITKAIIGRYEQLRGNKFSDLEEQALVRGSADEDSDKRFLNHFYDPMSGKGILAYSASAQWATDILKQANWGSVQYVWGGLSKSEPLFSGGKDYSWQRAVYEYVHGDKERAMEALGHALHLVEDSTVPAHVRNDMHPSEDVEAFGYSTKVGFPDDYEYFTEGVRANNVLKNAETAMPLYAQSIEKAIHTTATFTHANFLSTDTIFTYRVPSRDGLELERSIEDGVNQYFGSNSQGKIVRISRIRSTDDDNVYEKYFLTDAQNKILTENWQVLSNRAVASGMGVIDLFFRDVEQEKKTGALLAMNKSYYDTKRIVNALADERDSGIGGLTSLAAADVYELNKDDIDGAIAAAAIYGIPVSTVARNSPLKDPSTSSGQANAGSALLGLDLATQVPENTSTEPPAQVQQTVPAETPTPKPQSPATVQGDALNTSPTIDAASTPGGIQPLTFGGGGVGGGGGSSSSVSANTESSSAANTTPNTEPEPEPEPQDTTPPEVTLTIAECTDSISSDACVLANASDLAINWSATDDNLDYVTYQGTTTTNTEATDTIANNESKTFTVQAFDAAGNSTSKSVTVHVTTMLVVLNEVAWSGTAASATDEWIELYNRSPYAINLTGWKIVVGDNAFEIPLAGTIHSGAYFLIKQKGAADVDETTQSPITNVSADVWQQWGGTLPDRGAVLALLDNTNTAVDEVALCNNAWCAGVTGGRSMERINPDVSDDTTNWLTADVTVLYALDRSVSSMRGTPKSRNIATGVLPIAITANTTLTQAGSPYFISGSTTIPSGVTLSLQSGVVIKFLTGTSQLAVQGTLTTEGLSESPVVFSSFVDDTYAGDTNNDGTATTPRSGGWRSVRVENGGTANVTHTILRYGGRRSSGQSRHGALDIQSGGTLVADALTIEHAQEEGLYIRPGAMATIQNSLFQNNTDSSFGYGIYSGTGTADAVTISNSTFDTNGRTGLYAGGAGTYTIANNTFTNNGTALFVQSFVGNVSGNSGSNNTVNGITLSGGVGVAGTPITLQANSLPYRITTTTTIGPGAQVTLGAGARVESDIGSSKQLIIDGGTLHMPNGATFTSALDAPSLGAWGGVVIKNGGAVDGSGVEVSYAGGNSFYGEDGTGIYITDVASMLTLINSTIQHNKHAGIFMVDGTLTLSDTTIAHHTDGTGIDVRGGTATLTNITFDDNLTNTNPANLVP